MQFINNGVKRLARIGKKSNTTYGDLDRMLQRSRGASTSGLYGTPKQFLDAFSLASYAGNIISILADDLSGLDVDFYVAKKEIENEELDNFLIGGLSLQAFIQTATQHLLLDGNIFVLKKVETMANVVYGSSEFVILNPSDVEIYTKNGVIVTANTNISNAEIGYYRVLNNQTISTNYPPDQIIHFRAPSPHNTIRGMGKVQQNLTVFEQDRVSAIFNNQFFNQGAKIPYVIQPEETLSTVRFNEFSKLIHDSLEGVSNWMKMFVMPIKGEIKAMQVSHTDMQYLEQRKFTKEDIREIFQVPVIILGGADVRFDSAEEQLRAYYSFTLPRYGNGIERVLNAIYTEAFRNKRLKVKIEYPKVYSSQFATQAFDRGAVTPNELRKVLGFEEIEGKPELEEFYQTTQYFPVNSPDMVTTDKPEPAPPTPPKPAPEAEQEDQSKGFFFDQKVTPAAQARIHRRAKRSKIRSATIISKEIRKFYAALEKKCLENVKFAEMSRKVKDDLFDIEDEIYRAKLSAKAMFTSAIALGVADANEILGTSVDGSTRNPRVRLSIEKLAGRYSSQTIDTRREELRTIVDKWRSDAEPISELKGRIQEHFKTLTGPDGWRATRIARTEASLAWDDAAMMGYDEIGTTTFDVYGCEDEDEDCGRTGVPRDEVDGLEFHPNHTGTIIPSLG